MITSELKESEISQLRRACKCFYLEVHESIADDVTAKAEAVIAMIGSPSVNASGSERALAAAKEIWETHDVYENALLEHIVEPERIARIIDKHFSSVTAPQAQAQNELRSYLNGEYTLIANHQSNAALDRDIGWAVEELVNGTAPQGVAGWPTIESAPHDGTQILGWHKAWTNPLIVHYYTGAGRWSTTMQPTHWLPWELIPAPPVASAVQPAPEREQKSCDTCRAPLVRFLGGDWFHPATLDGKCLGSSTEAPGIKSAYRDSEGWVLTDTAGNEGVNWPTGWPEEVDAQWLLAHGVEVAEAPAVVTEGAVELLPCPWGCAPETLWTQSGAPQHLLVRCRDHTDWIDHKDWNSRPTIPSVVAGSGEGGEGQLSTHKMFVFGPCYHSMIKSDCPSCCEGHAARLESQLRRLEASLALPVKERVEVIILEAVTNWHNSWSRVATTTKDWIRNAAHSLSWDINRALPMANETAARSQGFTEGYARAREDAAKVAESFTAAEPWYDSHATEIGEAVAIATEIRALTAVP